MKCLVVGSGPAGASAASTLLQGGHSVTMLDIGIQLEPDRQLLVGALAAGNPATWDKHLLDQLRQPTTAGIGGLPQKLVYGSDFPYRDPHGSLRLYQNGCDLLISQALGGLSTAWGANVLPFLDTDIGDWPIKIPELAPFYRSALNLIHMSAKNDHLADLLPLYSTVDQSLNSSNQALDILADLEKRRNDLSRVGISFGQSRLAVRSRECVYCGLCLYGCPYGLIYSSAHTVRELIERPDCQYISGINVNRVEELRHGVRVHTEIVPGKEPRSFDADRVFLAAGAVGTTRIVLESFDAYQKELVLKDSQYFLAPVIRYKATRGVSKERLHTLSQIAIELLDNELSPRSIHMLVYTYNDLYERALRGICPLPLVRDFLLSRLFIIQGYLHSDDSASLVMRLEKAGSASLTARTTKRSKEVIRGIVSRLRSVHSAFGGMVLPFATHTGTPGKSYHVGGSLPMRLKPTEWETDVFGRLSGFQYIHIVDAACFPSIPATNVTLTVMANACRIAELSGSL